MRRLRELEVREEELSVLLRRVWGRFGYVGVEIVGFWGIQRDRPGGWAVLGRSRVAGRPLRLFGDK